MNKIKEKYPIITTAAVIIIVFGCMMIAGLFLTVPFAGIFIYEIIGIILPFAAVELFVGSDKVYRSKGFKETLKAAGYMFYTELFLLVCVVAEAVQSDETVWAAPVTAAYGILMLFGVGFREESLFRGLAVNLIGKKYIKSSGGIFFTAAATAALFGGSHMINTVFGANPFSAAVQSVTAFGIGFYLAAAYMRGKSIWAVILIHSLTNSASLFNAVFTNNAGNAMEVINELGVQNLIPGVLLSLIGLFLLRKDKRAEILERFNSEKNFSDAMQDVNDFPCI